MLAKIAQYLIERIPQTVNIQAVEADSSCLRLTLIMCAQPFGQLHDFLVGPHPGRPALEGVQDLAGTVAGVGVALDIAIDAIAVGPIALHREEGEAFLFDQSLAKSGPPGVILMRAVRSLAQQDIAGVSDVIQQRIEIGGRPQWSGE